MAVSESDRRAMHAGLVDRLGQEVADVLMEHLPPVGWAEVATKRDVEQAAALVRAEMRSQIAGQRGEIAALRGSCAAK